MAAKPHGLVPALSMDRGVGYLQTIILDENTLCSSPTSLKSFSIRTLLLRELPPPLNTFPMLEAAPRSLQSTLSQLSGAKGSCV